MSVKLISTSKVPLVLGVTGHRDLRPDDLPALRQTVKKVLHELKELYPHTPFVLMSPLAEGADRLVAHEALEPEIGATILAPLPLPRKLYEDDFQSADAKHEFLNFLNNSQTLVYELGLMPGNTLETISAPGLPRDNQYAWVGAHVALNCHILIALWDGAQSSAVGGTAQVVNFKLHGVPKHFCPPESIGDALSLGPVIHIHTRRAKAGKSTDAAPKVSKLYPQNLELHRQEQSEDFYHTHVFKPLDWFNAEPLSLSAKESSASQLAPVEVTSKLGLQREQEAWAYIQRVFVRADQLALRFRSKTRNTFWVLSILVAIAALCLDGAGHLPPDPKLEVLQGLILAAFPVLMLVAFLVFNHAKRNRFQDRYQDYRAIAEGLRVQFFWSLLDLKKSVANNYLSSQRLELFWIRQVCQACSLFGHGQKTSFNTASSDCVQQYWVENQALYFESSFKAAERRVHALELVVNALFIYGIVAAVILTIAGLRSYLPFLPPQAERPLAALVDHHLGIHPYAMLSIVMTAVIAALSHNYIEKFALHAHAKQYHRMANLFSRAAKRIETLNALQDDVSVKEAFVHLGREALAENGEWVLTHRERPVDVPHH